ncbi:hypothetical protein CLNEO_13480 [Anaerotignum neopropionicum]|uniref:Uncharacterized protein n=1 Tax=Anaerotignum neopropionicum TaxID=36847 RepID=A0A136WFY0_9FIRM|nr:hypothetical protein [Anaerotignum neopropionicum]KXL53377.1 hypothetical protein CLNEO_13480 [Anaerotignum neopropionicum]
MILDDILQRLEDDTELKSLLNSSSNNTGIYLNKTDKTDSIVYRFINLTSDAIKEQNRLEISCLSQDYLKVNAILERVKAILLTVGDEQFNNDVLEIALNGGGYLFDEDTKNHIVKAFFIVKNRYRR